MLNKQGELFDGSSKGYEHEYTGLVVDEPEELEMDVQEFKENQPDDREDSDETVTHTERWARDVRNMHSQHRREHEWRHSVASDGTLVHPHHLSPRGSLHSDETLHEHPDVLLASKKSSLAIRIGRGLFATAERVLVFLGYMQVLTGIVVYTGGCRDSYVNGCLAHLISTCCHRLRSPDRHTKS